MQRIRALIADDSVVYRSQIRVALSGIAWIEIVGAFSNGRLALQGIEQTATDLLILDLEMPEMDGLEVLRALKARGDARLKTIVFSSASKRGAEIALEALQLGASDFVLKPNAASTEQPAERIRSALEPRITALFPSEATAPGAAPLEFPKLIAWEAFRPEIVVIGSSTGGPTALEEIFSELAPPTLVPILIVQHMPPIFTATFAERLTRISGIDVREAIAGEVLQAGRAYVAPGDYHLSLKKNGHDCVTVLDQMPPVHSVRPAVDRLFETAAAIFSARCFGVVLTGMGRDGESGAVAIKNKGGVVAIQSQESCVVFGMPGAVAEKGAYDRVGSPREIAQMIREKAAPTERKRVAC